MTYKEWAQEYYDSAANVKEKITRLKAQMKTAVGAKLKDITDEINVLYGMYLDCMHVADMLAARKGEC